jgi:hypothetical protein
MTTNEVSGKPLVQLLDEERNKVEELHKILGQKRKTIRSLRDHLFYMNVELTRITAQLEAK